MKTIWVLLFIFWNAPLVMAGVKWPQSPYPDDRFTDSFGARQLLIVTTEDWNSVEGTLWGYEKIKDQWVLQFSNLVVLGKNGLGLGEGILPLSYAEAPAKREGDWKSPAGIFKIGTAFGYADYAAVTWIQHPYVKASDTLICIDDDQSASYNQLVKNDDGHRDWKSFEQMHRPDNYYKWGLFVEHNAPHPQAGKGSCIFLHIWENPHEGTVGCTAMKEEDILRILHWINSAKHPVLVQLPKKEYALLASQLYLPEKPGK